MERHLQARFREVKHGHGGSSHVVEDASFDPTTPIARVEADYIINKTDESIIR
ncbi:MAG TPA: hypothetical protein VGW36_01125 [Pyrinomonadaceae bacterium]|nr:hypothetical protein [Pyrinomonadaceae bacterium]